MKTKVCKSSVLTLIVAAVFLASCSSVPTQLNQYTATTAQLKDSHFKVVKKNLRGVSTGFRLLGFIPIIPASTVDAMDKVQEQVESEGRPVTLVNVQQERQNVYLILFSLPRVLIRADAVEFLDAAPEFR